MFWDILIGLGVLAFGGGAWWIYKHPPLHMQPKVSDLASTLAVSAADAWEAIKRDLPEIVSAEISQLKAELAATETRAQKAEAALQAELSASQIRLAAVQQQVADVIAGINAKPATDLVAPAVAAAQAEDAAAVQALAAQLNPA
jgi:hypothetical protein